MIWGHYADSHRGVAIELEIPEKYIHHVDYVNDRIMLTEADPISAIGRPDGLSLINRKLLRTKYIHWKYEDEARVVFSSEEAIEDSGIEFVPCDSEIQITGVISGALCDLTEHEIASYLPSNSSIKFTKGRTAFKKYDIVPDQRRNNITINSSN